MLRFALVAALILASPSLCQALPFSIPSERVTSFMRGGIPLRYAWFENYNIGFRNRAFDIDLSINLLGANPGPLVDIWERGIETTWSDRFWIIENDRFSYPTKFDVEFSLVTKPNAHHNVRVHSGFGRFDMLNWYTLRPPGRPHELVAAHEFGHMLGNFDEYPGGGVNPNGQFGAVFDSLMGIGMTTTLYDRHFQFAVDWASAKSPGGVFRASATPAPAPIPEPATLLLVGTTAAGIGAIWRRRRRATGSAGQRPL